MAYNKNESSTYVGAPYNFVPFNKEVVVYPDKEAPSHIKSDEELFSGEIEYHITAQTPIFVGSGKKMSNNIKLEEFYKDIYDRYAIPGSSMRGLIRSNVQVLSLSGFGDDIDDYYQMHRNVANGPKKEKDRYANILGAKQITINNGSKSQQVSVLTHVRAGYLKNENGSYKIYDTSLDQIHERFDQMNYYILSERKVVKDYLRSPKKFSYSLFYQKGKNILQHDLNQDFRRDTDRNNRVHYKGRKNRDYKPYEIPCSYELNGREVTAVGLPGRYRYNGYAVSTGYMNEKKAIYIIPEMDAEKTIRHDGIALPIDVTKSDVKAFEIDYNKKKTSLGNDKDHYKLPENGKIRPVFYIRENGRLYFGFTPRLRLFDEHTIKDGLSLAHKGDKLDYAKALFGYSNKDDSYKSRVSFTDAVLIDPQDDFVQKENEVDAILGEPKPTSYMDYLISEDGKMASYNDKTFQLRGMKQYWLRDHAGSKIDPDKKEKDFVSHFKPLPKGCTFAGKVRFHNLKKEEIGLLLWAIRLEDHSWMNIGKAKAFGYGNIKVDIRNASVMNASKAYDLNSLQMSFMDSIDTQEYIDTYKGALESHLGGKSLDSIPSIQTLLLMKNGEKKPNPNDIRYMSIDDKEYQRRKDILPLAKDVIGGKSANAVRKEFNSKPGNQNFVKKSNDRKALKVGATYEATVNGYQGAKIKIKFNDAAFGYGQLALTDITCSTISKKEMKSALPTGAKLQVKCLSFDEQNKAKLECIKIF